MTGFFDELEAQLHTAAQAQTAGARARLPVRWARLRTKMRVVPALVALAVTVGVVVIAFSVGSHAHRGTSQSHGVAVARPGRTTTAATATANTATTSSGRPDCNAAGINAQLLREGTCLQNAMTVVVVNRSSTLHLKSLDANYGGFHRDRKFAIATITIKNKLGQPQRWQHTQAALLIPGGSAPGNHPFYVENLDAETGDHNSCLWKTGTAANGGLQPGKSVTCDVVVEIPAGADPAETGSELYIANFGDDVSNSLQPVGIIRTYH
jgi:hypothetical protein